MKYIILFTCLFSGIAFSSKAQENETETPSSQRQKLYIREDITLHFTSPEPIQYVDISCESLVGDLPLDNVFRIKILKDSVDFGKPQQDDLGVVTIIGQKFIAQYDLYYAPESSAVPTLLEILPTHMRPLDIGTAPLSQNELRHFCREVYKLKPSIKGIRNSQYGIWGYVDNIHTLEDYIFLDITFINDTNLKFDIDQVRFRVEDRKIVKATNVQAIELEPAFTLFERESFKRKFRNIYVLEKFSFPNNKVLIIELTETQLSGRSLTLEIDYADLLRADTL